MNPAPTAFAPIALFAYRRPAHLRQTLQALQANPEAAQTELFVFCDGARNTSMADDVVAVRDMVRADLGFASTHVVTRDSNFGLARNITEGVSEVLGQRETVIVLEDDIVVSPFFLRYMNDALRCYRDSPPVGSISGFCFPVTEPMPETYFIRGADCWGWATWRDRWKEYNPDGPALLAELKARDLCHAFDLDGAMGFVQMLEDQIAGRNDSWAVRWHASCFLRDRLMLYPGRALAHNIGQDGTGTHSLVEDDTLNVALSATPVTVGGIAIEQNAMAREAICSLLRKSPQSVAAAPIAIPASQAPATRKSLRGLVVQCLPGGLLKLLRDIRRRFRGQSAADPPPGPVTG